MNQDAGLVYNMTNAMVAAFPEYKDAAPGNSGWAKDRQNFSWVIPYHDGAIKYWKEAGLWKPEHQAHNDKLMQRQKVMADAWEQLEEKRAVRQGGLREGLDEGARRRADQGRHGPGAEHLVAQPLSVSAPSPKPGRGPG